MCRFYIFGILCILLLSQNFCCGYEDGYKVCNINPWFEADADQLYSQVSQQSPAESISLSGPRNDWLTAAVMLIADSDVTVLVSADSPAILEDNIQLRVMGKLNARNPQTVVWDPIMDPYQVRQSVSNVINGDSIKDFPVLRISSSTPAIVWITVDLSDIYTGIFTSTLKFVDSHGNTKEIPLRIEVLDAKIPIENPLHCFTWQYSTASSVMINDLIDHGVNVFHVNRQEAWDYGAKFMLFFFGTSWSRQPITDIEQTRADVRSELDIIWGFIEDNNVPIDRWAIMLADEVSDSTYEIDIDYAQLVKEYKPDTPICFNPSLAVDGATGSVTTTLNGAIINIAPYCDIWMPYAGHLWGALGTGPGIYNYIDDQRNNHGKRFWVYDIWGASGRHPAIGRSMFRRGSYVAWKYRLGGFSNYALNAWGSQQPWNHVSGALNYSVTYSVGDPPLPGRGYEVLRQGFQEYKKMYRLLQLGMPMDDIDEWADDCASASTIEVLDTANDQMNQALVQYTAINRDNENALLTDSAIGNHWLKFNSSACGNGQDTLTGGYDDGPATKLCTSVPGFGNYYSIWYNNDIFVNNATGNSILETYLKVPKSGYSYIFFDLSGQINEAGDVGHVGFRVNSNAFTGDWEKYSFDFDKNIGMINDITNPADFSLRTFPNNITQAEKSYLFGHMLGLKISVGHGWITDSMFVDDTRLVGSRDCEMLKIVGDLDGNCVIDIVDFAIFSTEWLN